MSMIRRSIGAVAVAVALSAMAAAPADFPAVGTAAPSFKLKSNAGKNVRLSDYRGKWVVLYFYPKDFTGGCTLEAKNFQRDLEKYSARNAAVVGVSVDSAESHKQFCTKESLNFTLLSDPQASTSEAYHALMVYEGHRMSSRNTFLIDPKGKVARVFPAVKPTGHSEEVLAALDGLQKKTS